MRHDLRDALRNVLRSPGYSLITIAVLALGIGATSAIFSFVDGVLLRPLPYGDPDRIVRLWERPAGFPDGRNSISTANFRDWQDQNDVFEAMAATTNTNMTMTGGSEARQIRASRVSAGYFEVIVEVALACTLLVGSGLLMRSFMKLQEVEAARDPSTLLTASLGVANTRFSSPDEARAFYRRILERTETLPGVADVALTSALPMRGWGYGMPLRIGGRPAGDAAARGGAFFKMVTPSYFQTIGLPLLKGRPLETSDSSSSVRVLVVNKAFIDRYFPGEESIGKHVLVEEIIPGRPQLGPEVPWEIVGVVANERTGSLSSNDSNGMYVPMEQSPYYGPSIIIRTTGDSGVTATSLKAAIHEIDPNQSLTDVRTLESIKDESVSPDRLRTWLIVLFGAISGLLAAIGIYGVISYSVAQRTHEIGVRAALGASRGRLMGLVMRRATILTVLGLALGVGGALASGRLLQTLLFGIAPRDIVSLVGAVVILGVVATIAAWVPARRAARVDPLVALRVE